MACLDPELGSSEKGNINERWSGSHGHTTHNEVTGSYVGTGQRPEGDTRGAEGNPLTHRPASTLIA